MFPQGVAFGAVIVIGMQTVFNVFVSCVVWTRRGCCEALALALGLVCGALVFVQGVVIGDLVLL